MGTKKKDFKVGDIVIRISDTYAGMRVGDIDEVRELDDNGVKLKKYRTDSQDVHSYSSLELCNQLPFILKQIKKEIYG